LQLTSQIAKTGGTMNLSCIFGNEVKKEALLPTHAVQEPSGAALPPLQAAQSTVSVGTNQNLPLFVEVLGELR
jgi:hypothetical protein